MPKVLLTGAAGEIGGVLSDGLGLDDDDLRLLDLVEPTESRERDVMVADITDYPAIVAACDGVDCVIHLAGIPHEAGFSQLLENNILGTFNVFEAARQQGVRRVVYASTNHVVGFHRTADVLDENGPYRPDTLYGVTKVFGETLGRLYHDKYGLEVICLRIGSFRKQPTAHRELSTWLSHGDAIRLFECCISASPVGYVIAYGVSANRRVRWHDDASDLIGYVPRDDAERFADVVGAPAAGDRFHGGAYTNPDHVGGF